MPTNQNDRKEAPQLFARMAINNVNNINKALFLDKCLIFNNLDTNKQYKQYLFRKRVINIDLNIEYKLLNSKD